MALLHFQESFFDELFSEQGVKVSDSVSAQLFTDMVRYLVP